MSDVEEHDLRRPGDPAPATVPLWRVQLEALLPLVCGVLVLVAGAVVVVAMGSR